MTRTSRILITLLATVVIAGGVAAMMSRPAPVMQKKNRWAAEGPVPVRVANATTADVPVFVDAVGTARALNTVSVQPQVGGKILEIGFKEGQTVEKGQVLARIDPSTYQAAFDQAKAKLSQDQSQLANAKLDLDRYLKIPGAIPVKTVDTQRALVTQLTGQVAMSKAAVDSAQVQLDFTNIVAPLTGRTGIRQVDQGNIVSGSGGQSIVTITQVQPISVIFNLPQQRLVEVNRAAAAGAVAVNAMDGDNKGLIDAGRLQVVDNQVDQTTGTVRMKAEFPNAQLQLWPGQFVNVRVLVDTRKDAVTVPTAAVQRGPNGTFVYVAADDKAVARNVTVALQDDVRAVIGSGVEAGERVVTSGFARLKDGTQVAVATTEELEAAPVAPKREGKRGQGGKRKREGSGEAGASANPPGAGNGEGQANGERKRGEGRRKRQEDAPAATVPPAAPATTSSTTPPAPSTPFKGQVGQKAPEAAAQ